MANEGDKKKEVKQRRSTAEKRILQSKKRETRNYAFKSSVRTAIRRFEETLSEGKDEAALKASLNNVYSMMDRGVKRGLFKLNKASRTKARLTQRVQAKA